MKAGMRIDPNTPEGFAVLSDLPEGTVLLNDIDGVVGTVAQIWRDEDVHQVVYAGTEHSDRIDPENGPIRWPRFLVLHVPGNAIDSSDLVGAIRFLYWLQKTKRYSIGGYQKPRDWLDRTLTSVSTPAAELLAEFIGDDLPLDDLSDDDVDRLSALRPIDRERQELIKAQADAHRAGQISWDEFVEYKQRILREGIVPAQGREDDDE